ncbi:hypothetical protein IVB14_24445 [Bradyrhizobium sp. 180]|uniref:hypothetical protein n=1 Tax=Bradyrhizobium sp. 180 TaxID=2782650 RepID=UPI001FFB7F87|nr:hypothetical protein [Bradyrhizobium sp. 180]MCK1493487.1 hypothetical protein [Bradyrhizobium sp. 180]
MTMTKQDRAERIRMLAKLAIGILRRNDAGGYLDIPGKGRVRALKRDGVWLNRFGIPKSVRF